MPLHIFEDRYRRMIEQCLAAEPGSPQREFGIVWLSDEELKQVGCACEIERVLERMDDGRLNILARGTRPFRLLERQDDLPYPAGVVEFLDDEDEQADAEAAQRRARALRASWSSRPPTASSATDELAAMDAYRMAARSSSASTPSRSCSSCARRTRACACSRCCCAPRSSAWSWSSARRHARSSNGKVRFG